jgi:hypothetical protein
MSIAQVGAALRPFMVALLAAQQRGHRFGNGQRRLRRDNQPTPSPTSSVKSVGSALAEAGRSGGYGVVLVYEAAENVVAPNLKGRDRGAGRADGDAEADASVRPLLVVVAGVSARTLPR